MPPFKTTATQDRKAANRSAFKTQQWVAGVERNLLQESNRGKRVLPSLSPASCPSEEPHHIPRQTPNECWLYQQGMQSRHFPAASNRSQPGLPISFPPCLQSEQNRQLCGSFYLPHPPCPRWNHQSQLLALCGIHTLCSITLQIPQSLQGMGTGASLPHDFRFNQGEGAEVTVQRSEMCLCDQACPLMPLPSPGKEHAPARLLVPGR